jgi:hypothetical protein
VPDLTEVINASLTDIEEDVDAGGEVEDVEGTGDEGGDTEGTDDAGGETDGDGDAAPVETDADETGEQGQKTETTPAAPAKTPRRIRWREHERLLKSAEEKLRADITARDARLQKLAWAESEDAQSKIKALDIADTNPELFFNVLMQDSRYAALLDARLKTLAPRPEATAAPAASDRPKPDVLNPDGSLGYSEKGLAALLAFERAEAVREAEKRLSDKFDPILTPIIEERQAGEKFQAAKQRQAKNLQTARDTWAGFKEHEADIAQWLRSQWFSVVNGQRVRNPAKAHLGLMEAYQAVVVPKFQADRTKMRDEILKEMTAKGSAPIKAPAARKAPSKTGGPRRIEDVINEAISGLE